MKKITLLLIMTCLFALKGHSQTQFWSDTFDSSPISGARTTEENGGTTPLPSLSYFKLTDGSTISQVVPFTGKQGTFFWAGEDHNALGTGFTASGAVTNQTAAAATNELQIDWTGINISGKTGLSFKGLIAAASTNEPWDNTNACISGVGTTNTDYIIVEYSIDGSPYTSLIRFFNRGSASGTGDKYLFEDTDGNGCGDGTQLTNAFNEFTKTITGTGNTLSLRIRIFSEGNNEEWGIDNFRLFETPSCPTVTVNPLAQTNVSCNGGSNGAASVTASGGTGLTYNWTPGNPTGDGTAAVTGLTPGIWTCTVTNSCGNSSSTNITITQPTAIVVTAASQTNVACFGGTTGAAQINTPTGGSGGYTYNWTPGNPTGDGTTSVTGLSVGTWTCTVTDANGCTTAQNFNITQPTALTVTPASQTNVSCFGGTNGAAQINTPTGGAGSYTYNWTPGNPTGDGTISVTGLSAGNWTCTITDANGCTVAQNFTIIQPTAIVVTPASQTNVACFGGTSGAATINIPTGGAGGYTYNWTPGNPTGDGTTSVTGLAVGVWTCTVTDANGCIATRNFTITQPSALTVTAASQTNIACFGGTTGAAQINTPTGGAGGYTYNWTPGNPTGDGTVSVTGLGAGTWTCTVTDANGCSATQNFNITQPTALTVTPASQTNVSCFGGTNGMAQINTPTGGAGGYFYNWTPGNPTGDGTVSVTGLTAGTWTCTVTDANGCTVAQNFTITEPAVVLAPTANATQTFCNGATVANLAATGSSLQWYLTSSGGSPLATTTVLLDATDYYVSQTIGTCESNRTTVSVTLNPSTTNTSTALACDSYTWGVNGTTYTTSGTYNFVTGCNTEVLNLTITPSTTNTTSASACDSYTWAVNGTTYTTSGTYNFISGCTTEVLNLTITPSTTNTSSASACDTYTWAVNGTTYTTSGTYNFVSGCNTEVLNLTITPSTTNTTDVTACDTYTWAVNGITYTTSGTYNFVSGCTTEVLNLIVTPSTTNTTDVAACDTYTWAANGTTYTTSGTYNFVSGCTTEVLNLTITPSTTNTSSASACDSYTWAANGTTYTTSGTYNFVSGCNTEVLNLTITPTPTVDAGATPATACADSIVVLTGTVSPVPLSGFTGAFDPANWNFANTNANGSVNTAAAPASIALTGGNNGTGSAGNSDYTIVVPASGNISFNWSYTTTDGANWDRPRILINGTPTILSGYNTAGATSQSGTMSVAVTSGQTFGFNMFTLDNSFGAATVTLSNFVASATPALQWTASNGGTIVGADNQLSVSVSSAGTYTLTATNGTCSASDSVDVNYFVATPQPTADVTQSFCDAATVNDLQATGTAIQWFANPTGGTALNATDVLANATTYYVSQTLNGCESIRVAVNVVITPSTTNTTDVAACDTYTWAVNGTTYTASGTYNFVFGCNTEVLNLTITPSTTNTTDVTACDTYTWAVNGTTYTSSGTYNFISGCNTEVLNLTITPSTTNTTDVAACDSYTWAVNGTTYTTSGTYNFVSGCNTEVLNLTISPSTTNTSSASACDSYTWAVNGTTYTSSGTYNFVSGCTTEVLNLTITPTPTVDAGVTPATACADSIVVLTGTVSPVPLSGFTGAFDPANWNFANTNANGSVNTAAAPASIALTGGNNGTGSAGNSDYTIVVPVSGNISFNWSYTTTDGANWDRPRILINGTPTILSGYNTAGATSQSGTMSVAVTSGQTFGFNMFTLDNSFGAATVTLSNFVAAATPPLQWTATNGGTIVGADNQLSVSVSSAGTYTLTATNGTCMASDSVDVTYFAITPQPTADATQSFCDPATISNLQASGTAIQWFVSPTGGTALNATDVLVDATTYYVSQTLNGCESTRVAVNVIITPSTINTTDVSVCDTYTWAVNGTTYTTSGTYNFVSGCNTEVLNLTITPSTTNTTDVAACDSYTWAANATTYTNSGTYTQVSGCATEVLNLTITPTPTVDAGATPATACADSIVVLTGTTSLITSSGFTGAFDPANWNFANTNANGSVNTAAAPASIALTGGNNGTGSAGNSDYTIVVPASGNISFNWSYTTTDGANWDRPRILINGTPTILSGYNTAGATSQSGTMNVAVTAGQTFGFNMFTLDNSFGAATVTLSNFVASATPALQWTASNGGTIVGADNQLSVSVSSAGTYTLTATNGTCTASDSVDVNYFVATPQPTADATQSFCDAATINDLQATGTAIQWFVAPTGGTALNTTDALANATTYYVSQTLNGCESIRVAVNVVITPSTTNTTDVTACDTYTWAVNGTTYTASGTYNFVSGCNTEVLNLTITPSTTNTTDVTACDTYTWAVNGTTYTSSGTYNFISGCNTEVLNLTITPSTTNTTDVAACDSYTWAVNGTTYTTSGTYNFVSGCNTEVLNLTINSVATPTGDSAQTLSVSNLNDATIANIVVSPTNVIWYGSIADALAGINALDPTTVVTTGSTYYAVSVLGSCSSTPFAVTITVVLGTESFNNMYFNYYPNPTSDILNIKYSEVITEVSVTNLLGQTIFTKKTNSTEVQIDLSSLPTETYLIKVSADGKSKIVKVIKK